MSTFFGSYKRVVVKDISATSTLQLDAETTLSFYIVERVHETPISTIEYQVEKVSGRSTTIIDTWTSISKAGVQNNVYNFDYTLLGTAASISDNIQIRFKIVDYDGIEYFRTVKALSIIE